MGPTERMVLVELRRPAVDSSRGAVLLWRVASQVDFSKSAKKNPLWDPITGQNLYVNADLFVISKTLSSSLNQDLALD